MTRILFITRVLKPALSVAAPLPFAWAVFSLAAGHVEGDQVKYLQHVTGLTVLVTLFLTLAITPVRRLTGWNEIIRIRRQVGLTAFWYALIHFLTYVVFDQSLSLYEISRDVMKHPWVWVGFASFLMLIPLAVTSTDGWVRRLGGKGWRRLHRLVYLSALGGVLHFLWLVKRDVRTPTYFGVVLGALFVSRLWVWWSVRRSRARRPATFQESQGRVA
ncbi:MAG: sulfite oxidase heme-binding subunit YedZ [Gemmatimonadales bacterium]